MLVHRGFPTITTDRPICALSLAPSRAPFWARARARLKLTTIQHRASSARSERPAHKPVSRPSSERRLERGRRNRKRAWCWRRGHIHFSPVARPLLQAGSPEWSVASEARRDRRERLEANGEAVSDAEGGSGERGGPLRNTVYPDRRSETQPMISGLRKGEICSPDLSAQNSVNTPTLVSTVGTTSTAVVVGCRAVEAFRRRASLVLLRVQLPRNLSAVVPIRILLMLHISRSISIRRQSPIVKMATGSNGR